MLALRSLAGREGGLAWLTTTGPRHTAHLEPRAVRQTFLSCEPASEEETCQTCQWRLLVIIMILT